ncbi:MAG: hypothetical protein J6N52_04100 [Clostridia bacterium]|nr:hypothetical protein [Clostridia bacterium]
MKRKLILLLSAALCFTSIAPAAAEDTAKSDEEAVIAVDEERAQMLLKMDAVYYSESPEDLTRNVSRGEFAKILVKYFGYTTMMGAPVKKPYVDVELTNGYVREIKVLKDIGIVTDDEKLKFRPDDSITVSEASVMLALALGYKNLGETLTASAQGEVIKGVERKMNDAALLDDIYAMLENCFDIEMVTFGASSGSYGGTELEKETVLTKVYKAVHKRGVVTANSCTGLSEAGEATVKGFVEIDNVVYSTTTNSFGDYLGYTVDYYIKDNSEDELLYAVPYKLNKTLLVDGDDIVSVKASGLTYYNDKNHSKTVNLDSNFDVIYNKKAYTGYGTLDNVIPEEGDILFLDNDGDNKYDTMFVTSYEFCIVGAVDVSNGIVYDSLTEEKLDFSDEKQEIEIYNTEGGRISLSGLKPGNALSIAASRNTEGEKIITAYVSPDPISGTVKGIGEDTVTVGSNEYECTEDFEGGLKIGSTGMFYLTATGKIFHFKVGEMIDEAGTWKVGLVYRKGINDEDESTSLTVFTPDNEFIFYSFDEKVQVKKTSSQSGGIGFTAAYNSVKTGDIIRYKVDSDGEISTLQPADAGMLDDSGEKTYSDPTSLRLIHSGSTVRNYWGIYNQAFGVDDETIYFVIPDEEDWNNKRRFGTSYSFSSGGEERNVEYAVYGYGEFDIPIADIFVIKAKISSTINKSSTSDRYIFVVEDVYQALVDEEVVYKVTGVTKGSKSSFYCTVQDYEDYGIQPGDIIWLAKNTDGFISAAERGCNILGKNTEGTAMVIGEKHTNAAGEQDYGRLEYGEVIAVEGNYIIYKIPGVNGTADTTRFSLMSGYVTKADLKEKSVTAGNISEVTKGDKVVGSLGRGLTFDLIVLK